MASSPFNLKALLDDQAGHPPLNLIEKHINPAYAKVLKVLGYDIRYTKGQGPYLWDEQGNKYLDCLSGFGVFGVGRNHPDVRDAIKQAMDMDLPNLPKFGPSMTSGLLAEKLIEIAPDGLDTVYFCNSGAEGCETAIKYARAATGKNRIIYCQKAYHGLTMGALSINGGLEFRDGFGALLNETTPIPFNDIEALEQEILLGDVAGFIFEPIQGKGVRIASEAFVTAAAELCRKHNVVFIADEVQTGYGRTGRMFACEHFNIHPDILVTAKAISGGYVPLAAVLSRRSIHNKVFSTLDRCVVHSTTFGQNDLSMVAGLATLHVLEQEKVVENADRMGQKIIAGLTALVPKYDLLKEVRGKGLMIAVEFGTPKSLSLKVGWQLLHKVDGGLFPQAILIPLLKDHHILAQVAGHNMDIIKLLPSLTITEQDADHLIKAFDEVIAACHRFPGPAWEVGKRLTKQVFKRSNNEQPLAPTK
ncbi:Acetylornithine/acetyl-lysine aminotransferase [Poriferisphaera corsica]|uniref:Acetylornithine/acetyl-lysine aminotransferase n=1 Tax=Poriferisphaera corsica TaxID=2528020 RepID=A0A517YWJ3_9BACT|nr:aspartate aminotransferase family protein [Poriferisphaera corsica]QDU34582.1 Acetylornithine/acetyl-lysine aminotransferase [Poriferisphaera corsica]